MDKTYLGDAVYAEWEPWTSGLGGDLILTTEDGIRATNRIVLEPQVVVALLRYVADLRAKARRTAETR